MNHSLDKPLYALTVGEFVQLMQETIALTLLAHHEPEPLEQEEYFNIEQLKAFLNCSKVTLHNYKNQGMPYFRVGRKLLFKKSEVLDFMRKNVKRFYGGNRGK